jgi:membrane protein DedA with SNARE-associated domain
VSAVGQVLAGLASLFFIVLVGAVVPILPTGAAVSAAAAVAWHRDGFTVFAVVAAGAAAAYGGDAVMFALCRAGGEKLTQKIRFARRPIELAETVKKRINRSPVTALLVSRLVPAGRIPMLLAAAVVGISWRRFAVANISACALWSTMYAGVGLLGGAVFPEPWQGIVAAIVIVLVVSWLIGYVQQRREEAARKDAVHAAEPADSAQSVDGVGDGDGAGHSDVSDVSGAAQA